MALQLDFLYRNKIKLPGAVEKQWMLKKRKNRVINVIMFLWPYNKNNNSDLHKQTNKSSLGE